jgi:hypothetical protein
MPGESSLSDGGVQARLWWGEVIVGNDKVKSITSPGVALFQPVAGNGGAFDRLVFLWMVASPGA